MSNLHATYLTEGEVRQIALGILGKRFKAYRFQDVEVREDETFDGDAILRMVAHVESRVPPRTLIDVNDEIHQALRAMGEDRFVFLGTRLPAADAQEADEDEE